MKISQIAAKAAVRVFLILLLASTLPFLMGNDSKLNNFNFIIRQKWTLVFPAILILGFIGLLVTCTIKKYKIPDLNWLLVVNTVVLMIYLAAIFIRVYQAVA
jgi:hypothetical protein